MDFILAPKGWRQRYERSLQAVQKTRLAAIVPFPKFNKFPKEIRQLIWKESLPGPRTICPGDPRYFKIQNPPDIADFERYQNEMKQMVFPKHYHTPNPSALRVCRESREIALTRYRLCFGTPNVYANLEIDILYFGPWYTLDLDEMWEWIQRAGDAHPFVTYTLNPAVKADLEKVQRIGIKYLEGWQEYDDTHGEFHKGNGWSLRRQLRAFKSLKEVLLSYDFDGDGGSPFFQLPGQIIVDNWDVHLEPPNYEDWDESEDEDLDPYDDLPRQRSENVLASFKGVITAKDGEHDIPEVKLVAFKHVPDVPDGKCALPDQESFLTIHRGCTIKKE